MKSISFFCQCDQDLKFKIHMKINLDKFMMEEAVWEWCQYP